MDSMYETLMGLPLFSGISYNKLSEIVGSTRLSFLKYLPSEVFIQPLEPCTHLKFLLGGKARISITNETERFTISYTLTAPSVILPDYFFGRSTLYPCMARAIDTVSIMQIAKEDFMKIVSSDEIFLYNYLNLISSNAQKSIDGIMLLSSGTLEERIAFWIIALTQRDATDIELSCRQRDLCAVFGVQRSSFTATLDSMKESGLLDYDSNHVRVHSRREVLRLLTRHSE
ncbi:MAG: Crp/Fnr family transcriptional regulator [Lachnoclostridium sp.]|nr:Crp/Fnr family transcriptional regulator [Lachnoclostridium sp.]